jgi:hypothetical protein
VNDLVFIMQHLVGPEPTAPKDIVFYPFIAMSHYWESHEKKV